ncbi:urea ABC transporter ATP-binding protein UrtD [Deinococcus sp.]|uniref:urea ABC transporter ATP-binding protein UrtD n=1 Tax=Deinococcus sp. TaxID=47478 RepID=UPI0025C4F3EC|nr:urea ABC transporter ATP-binding protein UrtD [Deinococcus sp.]
MPSEQTGAPLLDVRDITVSFDGFKAIQNLSLQVWPGDLRVLIGPNGAGKSTLLDTIIGKVRPASGEVQFGGEIISRLPEYLIARRGICRKFQAPGVLESLNVRDNLRLAVRSDKDVFASLSPKIRPQEEARVNELLTLTGLTERQDVQAGQLAHGEKQWLEIGMVVAPRPRLLLLDEPTAGMTAQETAQTAELIRALAGQHAVLVIDHDMHFVELLAAPVTVLHQGQVFREGSLATLRDDPDVMEIYLGRPKEAAD